ncbi:MAG: IS1 family transposase [Gammaproteobacteria bacterium]
MAVKADAAWNFVRKKANSQWLWLALDAQTRQVVAFTVGDHSRNSARKRWQKLPLVFTSVRSSAS